MINAYDIETFQHNNKYITYVVVASIDGIIYKYYYDGECDIIITSIKDIFAIGKKKICIYVHYINFDGVMILRSVSRDPQYKISIMANKSNIYNIIINFRGRSIEFKCSYKLLPSSLKSIAKSFELPSKLPYPYSLITIDNLFSVIKEIQPSYFNSVDEWNIFNNSGGGFNVREYSIMYCVRDVEITKLFVEIIYKFYNNLNINILKKNYSTPSISLKIFKKNFNYRFINMNMSRNDDNYVRKAYYGGRCEVFGNAYNDEKVYHYDFSGMYAQCMMEKMPYGLTKYVYDNLDINVPGFYDVKVFSYDIKIPVLPHHNIHNNKLLFTNGIWRGMYWFEELLEFVKNGGKIIEIYSGYTYEKYDIVFDKFVDYFTTVRELGNEYKTLGKLIINSAYGRFGMGDKNNETIIAFNDIELENYLSTCDVISIIEINGVYILELNKKNKSNILNSNVGIAAAITAKARIKWYKGKNSIELNGGRLLYGDTDSFYAAYKYDVLNMRHGEIFWDASKNDTIVKQSVFISPKTYGVVWNKSEDIKIKGFKRNILSFDDLCKEFYNNNNIVIPNNFQIIKAKYDIGYKYIEKTIGLSKYDKRIFDKRKKETSALNLINDKYYI